MLGLHCAMDDKHVDSANIIYLSSLLNVLACISIVSFSHVCVCVCVCVRFVW